MSCEVLLFSKIDRKSLIMCLQLHCGLTRNEMNISSIKLCSLCRRESLGDVLAFKEFLTDVQIRLASKTSVVSE